MDIIYTSLETKLSECHPEIKRGLESIIALDFTEMKQKFVIDEDFIGWDESNIVFAEVLYKNYLFLNLKYPKKEHLPPSNDIDDFWHGHILDTRRYYKDCKEIFGQILHHNPYFGYQNIIEKKSLDKSFHVIQDLHKLEFGDFMYEVR